MCGCLECTPYWKPVPQPRHMPQTGNRAGNRLVSRPTLNPLSHTSQGLSHQILYYSAFQFIYFAPPFSYPILLSSFLELFSVQILFSLLLQLVSTLHSYYFSPIQTHKTNFLVNGHVTSFFPALKIPTFSLHLQQSLLAGCGQLLLHFFFQFYLQSFTNFVFQITNFTVPSPTLFLSQFFNFAILACFFLSSISLHPALLFFLILFSISFSLHPKF